jgi:hypothetical protein
MSSSQQTASRKPGQIQQMEITVSVATAQNLGHDDQVDTYTDTPPGTQTQELETDQRVRAPETQEEWDRFLTK